MDSDSSAFSTEGTFLSVLFIVAVFLAVVCFAMVLVIARRSCLADSVLGTDPQPDELDVPSRPHGWGC